MGLELSATPAARAIPAPGRRPPGRHRADLLAVAILLALPAVVFGLPALLGHAVLPGDDLTQNMSAQVSHFGLVAGMSWVPVELLGVLRLTSARGTASRLGWMAVLAGAAGLTILAGEPRAIADAGVIVAGYAAWRLARPARLLRPLQPDRGHRLRRHPAAGRLRPWLIPFAPTGAGAIALVIFGRRRRPRLRLRWLGGFVAADLIVFTILGVVDVLPGLGSSARAATAGPAGPGRPRTAAAGG